MKKILSVILSLPLLLGAYLISSHSPIYATHFIVTDETAYYNHPVINEFFVDGTGEWIELYNPTDQEIDLTDWILDDNGASSTTYVFGQDPGQTTIPARGFLVVEDNFGLNDSGDTVRLLNQNKNTIDQKQYTSDPRTSSIGRTIDAGGDWETFTSPTKGQTSGVTLSQFYVDDDWNSPENDGGHTWGFDAFSSIQEAINFAPAGSTINVAPGEYEETLIINKRVTLLGDPGDGATGPGSSPPRIFSCDGQVVSITSSEVILKGFMLDGDGCGNPVVRLGTDVTGVTISDNEIINGTTGIVVYFALGNQAHGNIISGNGTGVENTDSENAFDATQNYWGSETGPRADTNASGRGDAISGNVLYRPFYKDINLSTFAVTSLDSASYNPQTLLTSGIFKLPQGESSSSVSQLTIQQEISINVAMGDGTGTVNLPREVVITRTDHQAFDASTLSASNTPITSLSGFASSTTSPAALKWGPDGIELNFSSPITLSIFVGISLNGQILDVVRSTSGTGGWTSIGILAPATCTVALGLCTFQATKASYYAATQEQPATTTTTTTTTSTTITSTSSSPGPASPPVCTDQKPGSGPTLVRATPGLNNVTLTWVKASDPVSYYLVNYSGTPGQFEFGNPNVGGTNTTSYTISNLSGGKTYYFKVRAGNGCSPGDFSNELASLPLGLVVTVPAEGFSEGVLGEETSEPPQGQIEGTQTPKVGFTPSPAPAAQSLFAAMSFFLIGFIKSAFNFFGNLLNR